jgi:hypothetical protein
VIFFLSAHSVLAKKFINQTVDIIGQLRLGSKKIIKPICSDFVFSKCQMLISKKITKPFCSHFQCSVLMSKIIIEPICSDLVFKQCPFSFGQEIHKPNCRLYRPVEAGLVLVSKKTEKPICIVMIGDAWWLEWWIVDDSGWLIMIDDDSGW